MNNSVMEYNKALRKAKTHKAAFTPAASVGCRSLWETTFLPSAKRILTLKETSWTTLIQSLPTKRREVSFKVKGNMLPFIDRTNEDILGKNSKEG